MQEEKQEARDDSASEADDATAPVLAPSEWDGLHLHPFLVKKLATSFPLGPTPIQAKALPDAILKGRDILACAETGSGKTLGYGLPLLNKLVGMDLQANRVAPRTGSSAHTRARPPSSRASAGNGA